MDERDCEAIKELWYSQPKHIKDKWLADPRSLDRLRGLWQECVSAPDWIDEHQFEQVRLLERLDEGRNFLVLLGIHSSGLAVCVKVPNYTNHPPSAWPKLNKAIENEIEVLHWLGQHETPGLLVPPLIGSGYCVTRHGERTPYVITVYWGGLRAVSRCRPDSPGQALTLWQTIANAVGHLHRIGVIHGDLHEENLFVNSAGQPVILDFGSAQLRRRKWWQPTTSGVRDFIPHVSTAIDEVALPHQKLSPAFDVFCLTQCMLHCSGSLFPLDDPAGPNPLRTTSRSAKENLKRIRCFHDIVRYCSANEPEFRLPTGSALASALEQANQGQVLVHRPSRLANAQVLCRRYPMLVRSLLLAAVLLLAVGYFVADRWRLTHAQLNEQVVQSARLSKTLDESNRASSIAFDSIRDLLSLTVRDDYLVSDQKKRWIHLRQSLSERLALILDHNTLSEQTALESLHTGLRLIQAHYEVDGVHEAFRTCRVCLEFCGRHTPASPEGRLKFRILHARVLAHAANISSQLNHLEDQERASLDYAIAAVELLHSIDTTQAAAHDWLEPYLLSSHDVLNYGLYSHRGTEWAVNRGAKLAEQILQRALAACPVQDLPLETAFALSGLYTLQAQLLHKSALPIPAGRTHAEVAQDVRFSLRQAETLLGQCEQQATLLTSISLDQIHSAQSVVSNLAGLSYTGTYEFAAAREALEKALQWREHQLQQRPGSIRSLSDCVKTTWNLADTYQSEAHRSADLAQPRTLYLKEASLRGPLVQRCKELVQMDRCQETENNHLVNALRLASAYRLAGLWDEVCQSITDLEQVQALKEPGVLHGSGEDLLLSLAVLMVKGKASSAHEILFQHQCAYVKQFLLSLARSTTADSVDKAVRLARRFLVLMKDPAWQPLVARAEWQDLINCFETIVNGPTGPGH